MLISIPYTRGLMWHRERTFINREPRPRMIIDQIGHDPEP
jgi:hypothetical protein